MGEGAILTLMFCMIFFGIFNSIFIPGLVDNGVDEAKGVAVAVAKWRYDIGMVKIGLVVFTISVPEIKMSNEMFGELVKAVVDVENGIMAVDAELHADEENLLLEHGSQQEHLWCINIYPKKIGDPTWIEFDSMINIKPNLNKQRTRLEKIRGVCGVIFVMLRNHSKKLRHRQKPQKQ